MAEAAVAVAPYQRGLRKIGPHHLGAAVRGEIVYDNYVEGVYRAVGV